MSFQIEKGLGQFELTDHHAILGIPLGIATGDIRKRYLKVAKSLHPDSREGSHRQLATQLLSKMINPAYEVFSQEKQRTEYEITLRYLGDRLAQSGMLLSPESDLARQLLIVPNFEESYLQFVQELSENQFQTLDQSVQVMEQLSELNLVYLQRQAVNAQNPKPAMASKPPTAPATASQTKAPAAVTTTPSSVNAAAKATIPPTETFVTQYIRRAEELIAKNRHQQAIMELREALKIDPQHSRGHSLLGSVYLTLNQTTMAKVHFTQALKIDPRDVQAIQGREKLAKLEQKAQKAADKTAQAAADKNANKGLFGLFGGNPNKGNTPKNNADKNKNKKK
jgi:curved DNA-binding protein CbpA